MDTVRAFGPELRRLRGLTGVSLAGLARLTHYSASHLSKVETGNKRPSVDLARRCDAALGTDGSLTGLLVRPAAQRDAAPVEHLQFGHPTWQLNLEPDGRAEFGAVSRRAFLATGAGLAAGATLAMSVAPSAVTSHTLSDHTVSQFRRLLRHMRELGQALPPAQVIPMLVAQTHALRVAAGAASAPLQPRLLTLAARFAEYTGWMAQEAGRDDLALWWTAEAVSLAQAGGDREMAVYALVRQALIAMYRYDARGTIALAQQAAAGATSHRVRGLAAQRMAQGYALAGDYDNARRSIDWAAAELAAAAPDQETTLGMATVTDPTGLTYGWCLHDLGRTAASAEVLQTHISTIPVHAWRTRARFVVRQALALAGSDDVDKACQVVAAVLPELPTIGSATVQLDVQLLSRELGRRRANPAVAPVLAALGEITGNPVAVDVAR
jgi:transcriptional regulator with XRE-family HTH domain